MGGTIKAMFAVGAFLALMIMIGDGIEDPPVVKEPWLPRIKETKSVNRKSWKATKRVVRPWKEAKDEHSEEWADFLETLENRGINIYDPDAEDIWEEQY